MTCANCKELERLMVEVVAERDEALAAKYVAEGALIGLCCERDKALADSHKERAAADKLAVLCAELRLERAKLRDLLDRRPHIDSDSELTEEHHDYGREQDEAACAEYGGRCAK